MATLAVSAPEARIDVLGVGAVAVDDVIVVPEYPAADAKIEVIERRRVCGGLAATALVTAARLDVTSAYAGLLGSDELSAFALERLTHEGVDVQCVVVDNETRPIHSIVIVDQNSGSRNIFFDASGFTGPAANQPEPSLICRARVVLLDHFGVHNTLRIARIARAHKVEVVADFENGIDEPGFEELLATVDHLILAQGFAQELTGSTHPADAAHALRSPSRDCVVVTCGAEGSWYCQGLDAAQHCPAFRVTVHNTTGCGDVFHGAYAAALVQGRTLAERVRFASAAAAITAVGAGGMDSALSQADVASLLAQGGIVQ